MRYTEFTPEFNGGINHPMSAKSTESALNVRKKALFCAFPYTIPIFAGFWFLGIAYGIYMHVSGFSFLYPTVMAIVIFGGSL